MSICNLANKDYSINPLKYQFAEIVVRTFIMLLLYKVYGLFHIVQQSYRTVLTKEYQRIDNQNQIRVKIGEE